MFGERLYVGYLDFEFRRDVWLRDIDLRDFYFKIIIEIEVNDFV